MTNRKDAYADYKSYPDRGCEYAPSCLNCPFPKCKFEEPWGIIKAKRRTRNEEIRQRFKEGQSISDLVKAFGVSQRIVQRAVRDG